MAEVVIDEDIRHGKPVVKGTRITVGEVLGMLESGMDYDEIKKEYGLNKEQIAAAVKWAGSMVRGEEVREAPA
ncbi:MAG: DUF433 domain-containing protein [Candidatus Aenigmatarchaeota archaeon]